MKYRLSFFDGRGVPVEDAVEFTPDTLDDCVQNTGYVKWMVEWVKQELRGDVNEDFPISLHLHYLGSDVEGVLILEEAA